MPEVEKQIIFNAFNVLVIGFVINLILSGDINYIINNINYIINYLINLDSPGFWFIIIHILTAYIMLTCIKIELGFHAAIKFNL